MSFIALGRSEIFFVFFWGGGEKRNHTVFRRERRGDQSSLTEYERGTIENRLPMWRNYTNTIDLEGGKLGKLYRDKTNRLLELL